MSRFQPDDDSGKQDQSAADKLYRAELHRWYERTDVLVTSLCLGANRYVEARNGGGEVIGNEIRQITMPDGTARPVRVQVCKDRLTKAQRDDLLARAEAARATLADQLGTPDLARWSWWAPQVLRSRRLLAWLASQRLIQPRPSAPGHAPAAGRPAPPTQTQRDAAADAVAREMCEGGAK
jgi:hypothetical protein